MYCTENTIPSLVVKTFHTDHCLSREGEENKAMSEASLTGGDDFRGSVDSLAEYFTDDGKFTEDGSFIGEYVDRKKITLPSASASQA